MFLQSTVPLNEVQLLTDRETGRLKDAVLVEMGTDEEETAAIEALDGAEWMGRVTSTKLGLAR